MSRVVLPDCRAHRDAFTLSPEDRRELVRRIAEKGAAAIDEFIAEREAEGDSTIARKVAKLREELMRRAQELRDRLSESFRAREDQIEAEYRARLAELQSKEEELRGRIEGLRGGESLRLEAALRANPVLGIALDRDVAARAPWWRRAWRMLARALRFLLFPILWLLRKLLPPRRAPTRVGLAVPAGATLLDRAGDLYLADAEFRGAVKGRLRAAPARERMRRAWERLLGREDYETLARAAMEQMLAEEAQRAQTDVERERRTLQETLGEIVAREEEARVARESASQALRTQAERDAAELERALREAPEREVKEAIVDELRASGMLRATGEDLVPTLRFMDAFASLVYDEEAGRDAGARHGVAGEYAEGEGHHRREPLRSAIEISRMDVPASLLRARSRHPHVRHLFEEDIVVYREERASNLHVVLVVDRSGSMEDNGRMEAAKRAALALHHAVKRRNRRNTVEVFLMDTSVKAASLREVWTAQPRGFTNHGAALRLARESARRAPGQRTLVYLVTDGLPEAYTKEGEDVAGHPERAMAFAKEQAKRMRREPGVVGFVMLLLEPEDEMFVAAAEALAKEAGGRVVPVDPQELAKALLRELEGEASPLRVAPGEAPIA